MARQGEGEQGHSTQPKRKRRPRRRLRTGNSRITRGDGRRRRVIYQGNDTVANRLWATMLEASGVLSMPREG